MACFDINGLKGTNDREGHSAGDLLIHRTAAHIRRVFDGKAYRTGGDEFVVILEKSDFDHYPELLEKLQKEIDGYNRNARADTQVSIARGIAIYNSETDLVFANVFKRADDAMYQNKAAMKERRRQQESSE